MRSSWLFGYSHMLCILQYTELDVFLCSGLWSVIATGLFMVGRSADCNLHAAFEGLCYCHLRLPHLVTAWEANKVDREVLKIGRGGYPTRERERLDILTFEGQLLQIPPRQAGREMEGR